MTHRVLYEDLMLLFLDAESDYVLANSMSVHNALAGAVLIELVGSGHVAFESTGTKLAVVDAAPPANDLLREALSGLHQPMRPRAVVETLRNQLRDKVMAQLETRGVLTVKRSKVRWSRCCTR